MKYFLNAISFLTIIKIPERFYLKDNSFWKSIYFFPAVGLLIGIFLSILLYSFNFIFHPILSIVLIMAVEVLITGGMHLDGLADSFDGIFSGQRDKKKIIEIMKKSDIGAFGVLSLIFLFLIKFALIYSLLMFSEINIGFVAAILFMPAVSRWTINYNFYKHGFMKRNGSLADVFINGGNRNAFIITTIYLSAVFLIISFLLFYIFKNNYIFALEGILSKHIYNAAQEVLRIRTVVFALRLLALMLFYWLTTSALSNFFVKKIGNLSGDAIGAQVEISEVIFLFYFYIIIRIF